MKSYQVVVAPQARRQFLKVLNWWIDNRPKAPDLFLCEFEVATDRLAQSPGMGSEYHRSRRAGVRRILLPRSHYHLYYEIIEAQSLIRILAVWHTARAEGPRL